MSVHEALEEARIEAVTAQEQAVSEAIAAVEQAHALTVATALHDTKSAQAELAAAKAELAAAKTDAEKALADANARAEDEAAARAAAEEARAAAEETVQALRTQAVEQTFQRVQAASISHSDDAPEGPWWGWAWKDTRSSDAVETGRVQAAEAEAEAAQLRERVSELHAELENEVSAREAAVHKVVELLQMQAESDLKWQARVTYLQDRASKVALRVTAANLRRQCFDALKANAARARAQHTPTSEVQERVPPALAESAQLAAAAEALAVQRGDALEVMAAMRVEIDDMSRLQAQLFGHRPLELETIETATTGVPLDLMFGDDASTDSPGGSVGEQSLFSPAAEDVAAANGLARPQCVSMYTLDGEVRDHPFDSRVAIRTSLLLTHARRDWQAVGVYDSFPCAPSTPEKGNMSAYHEAGTPFLLEGAGGSDGADMEPEHAGMESSARERVAEVLTEHLSERMAAVSELQRRLERTLGTEVSSSAVAETASEPRLSKASPARSRLHFSVGLLPIKRYSSAGIAVGAYEGFGDDRSVEAADQL